MNTFLSIVDNLSNWSGRVVAFLMVAITFIVVFEVTMRYVFNAPTIWAHELTTYLCAAVFLVGGAYALLLGAHIKVDVFYLRFPPRVRVIIDLVTAPLFFIGVGAMLWVGTDWTAQAIKGGLTSATFWDPVVWPVRSLIAIGAFLLLLQGVAKFIRDIRLLARTGGGSS